jgi:hypothetical protein
MFNPGMRYAHGDRQATMNGNGARPASTALTTEPNMQESLRRIDALFPA